MNNLLILFCGIFYSILCLFSIVTGIIYMSGKRSLNPLELSDKMLNKLDTEEKKKKFAKKMGLVTFIVGIVQGITAFMVIKAGSKIFYFIAVGFTIFSICSVTFKLKGKMSAFPILKAVFYVAILIILFLGSSRALYF